jgi:hypothetical protein
MDCTVSIIAIHGVIIASRTVRSVGFGQDHQFLIANFNNTQALGTLSMTCTIPPFDPVNGYSHLTTYRLRTTP